MATACSSSSAVNGAIGSTSVEGRGAARDGTGLVQHDRVEAVGGLEGLGRADQDARGGALACAGGDRQRGGQSQGAGAGDDQDGHSSDQGHDQGLIRGDQKPYDESPQRDQDDRGHEVAGHGVGQPLDGGPGTLGFPNHADDLGQHGVGADLGGFVAQRSGLVDGGADHLIPRLLGDRDRLPGHHRLVNGGASTDDPAVDWQLLARSHEHDVTDDDLLDGHVALHLVAHDPGGARLQANQGADRLPSSGLGLGLDQPAEQDQRDDHPDRLVVHLLHLGGQQAGGEGGHQAVAERGRGTDGDQRVHVRGAV